MSRWRNNGGWNKSHGTIEKTPRVDSFEAGEIDGWGTLFGYADGGIPLVLDCCHNTGCAPDGEWENLEVWNSKTGWSQTLELSRKENGFGGSQTFFLCPSCGERRRYLYQVGAALLCRKCSRLNYRANRKPWTVSMPLDAWLQLYAKTTCQCGGACSAAKSRKNQKIIEKEP